MNSLPGLITIAIATSVSLTASAHPREYGQEKAERLERQAIQKAVTGQLEELGIDDHLGLNVKFDVKYAAKGIPSDYAWRYPAHVTWSATTLAGFKVSGTVEGYYYESSAGTAERYFTIEEIGVSELNPMAAQRLKDHRQAIATRANLRSDASRRFYDAATSELTASEAAKARTVSYVETAGSLRRFNFVLRTKVPGQKITTRGSVDITSDETSRESRLRLSSFQVERKNTVAGSLAQGLRKVGGKLRALRGGGKTAR